MRALCSWIGLGLAACLLSMPVTAVASGASSLSAEEKLLQRAETCLYLAGEFNGDQSARDRELIRQQTLAQCDRIGRQLKALQARIPRSSPLQVRVAELLGLIQAVDR